MSVVTLVLQTPRIGQTGIIHVARGPSGYCLISDSLSTSGFSWLDRLNISETLSNKILNDATFEGAIALIDTTEPATIIGQSWIYSKNGDVYVKNDSGDEFLISTSGLGISTFVELDTLIADKSLINLEDGGIFTSDISVPDEVYGVAWNGSVEVPTKNAIYDKIESLSSNDISTFANLDAIVADKSLINLEDGGIFTSDISVPDEVYGVAWNGSVEVPTKNAIYDKIESLVIGAGIPVYEAVIDPGGNGNYTTIQAAITAGATSLFLRKGTHNVSAAIEIPNGLKITGESIEETIVINATDYDDFMFTKGLIGDISPFVEGNDVAMSISGTTVTIASTINVVAGDYLCLQEIGLPMEIASVTNATTFELVETFPGANSTYYHWTIIPLNPGFHFENFTLTNTMATSNVRTMEIYATKDITIRNIRLAGTNAVANWYLLGTANVVVDNITMYEPEVAFTSTFQFDRTFPLQISNCKLIGRLTSNLRFDLSNVIMNNCQCMGMDLNTSGSHTDISGCKFDNCSITCENSNDSSRLIISECTLKGGNGIKNNNVHAINGTLYESIISNCKFFNIATSAIEIEGGYVQINNNIIRDTVNGIVFDANNNGSATPTSGSIANNTIIFATNNGIYSGNGNEVSICGNVIKSSGNYGIFLYRDSNRNVINGNIVTGAGVDGIHCEDIGAFQSDFNIISNNNVSGSAGVNVIATGTGNILSSNIS